MSLLPTLIKNIQGFFPYISAARLDKNISGNVQNPLLSEHEIHQLKLRVRMPRATTMQPLEAAHQYMGDVDSIYRGTGLEYEESRRYQPGDDPRHMNWRLSARTAEFYMKVFREEKRPGVFILIDRRESMRFGTKIRLKVSQAARIAAILAFSAQQRSAVISGVILNSSPQWLNEARNDSEVFSWICDVCSPCPPLSSLPEPMPHAPAAVSMKQTLGLLQSKLTPGSRLYFISDFVDFTAQHQSNLANLAAKHSVHAIQVYDPAELHLPKAGQLHLYPGSTSDSLTTGMAIDTESITIRRDFRKAASHHFEQTEQDFRSLGISYVKISTLLDNVENRIPLL